MVTTAWWHERAGDAGGSGGIDDAFLRSFDQGVGAEIMGAGKWGYPGWERDADWQGAWGPNPPFHTPVLVLTHRAREAEEGKGVRIGGGATVIREFLAAGLVDHMHVVVVPILLARAVRLWDGLEGLENDYEIEATSSPSGVTHLTFPRPPE
jgi:RibD C-terminal domain